MDVAIGQAKFDATVLKLLALQTETARAGLLDLMAEEEIKIYAAPGTRDESWIVAVGGVAFGKVHRSGIEAPPGPR